METCEEDRPKWCQWKFSLKPITTCDEVMSLQTRPKGASQSHHRYIYIYGAGPLLIILELFKTTHQWRPGLLCAGTLWRLPSHWRWRCDGSGLLGRPGCWGTQRPCPLGGTRGSDRRMGPHTSWSPCWVRERWGIVLPHCYTSLASFLVFVCKH